MIAKKKPRGNASSGGEDLRSYDNYFVSVYAYHGMPYFGDFDQLRSIVETYWENIMGTWSNVEYQDFGIMPNCLHALIRIERVNVPVEPGELMGGMVREDLMAEKHREVINRSVDLFKSVSEFQWKKVLAESEFQFEGEIWQPGVRILPVVTDQELKELRQYIQDIRSSGGLK